jgi:hypothetical protein
MSNRADFTITFSPDLSQEQITAALAALSDYYRACGGIGFQVEFESKPETTSVVSQNSFRESYVRL